MLRWLLCAQQAGTELHRTAGFGSLKEQAALMDSRDFRSQSAYDASFLQTLRAWDEGEYVLPVVPGWICLLPPSSC